jgi:phenylalanyl-tRNA synthetase alpha chain
VNPSEFAAKAKQIGEEGAAAIAAASDLAALDVVRTSLLGRKAGKVTELLKILPELPPEDRREAGAVVNGLKTEVGEKLDARNAELSQAAPAGATDLDLTMPGRARWLGAKHPVTLVIEEIEEIFRELGFTVAVGPEAETEWYNFTSLNFPSDHPAMDMHDTLYLGEGVLLRTHTSPVQMRTMQNHKPPIRVLSPGNVYRRDFFDASHAPMFAQIEGLCVDEGISFVDLKAVLTHFANRFFGTTKTRFRPSFFPFTEPSAEMDVECVICGGSGCASCKGTGWMEILGSGMVHPRVLEAAGIDAEKYTGWAFGMGPARIAKLRYNIPDIRILYDSDVRFLEQVAR